MANTLTATFTPSGGVNTFTVTMLVTDSAGNQIGNTSYMFHISEFSAVVDSTNLNMAVLNFGKSSMTISNADYSTVIYNNPAANIYAFALSLAIDIIDSGA